MVTLQIGGNDIGFSSIIKNCAALTPWDAGCKGDYVTGGERHAARKDQRHRPEDRQRPGRHRQEGAAGQGVRARLPGDPPRDRGRLLAVGADREQRRRLPADRREEPQLDDRARAVASRRHYVDIYGPSIGYDACSSSKWVEPIIPGTDAAPVHPNATGMRGIAGVVTTAINGVVTS
ncbi:MAG: hypothetical protein U0P45_01975 [Acidimicrobiales bacterium]